ncbi:Ig-like domain-containing protein [Gemmatimonas sp.]|uniref:Ig-like domain-containing protein n=1 Tax=Gemmatimonas sp. TaxID=1962908 RepID=UPI0035681665
MRVSAPIANIRATLRATTTALALLGLAGCLNLSTTVTACTISVAPASLTLRVNAASAIVGTAFDCKGNSIRNKRISFSSSNTAVATVTTEGNVIAVSIGIATVSAIADDKSASVQVTVTPETAANVTITPSTLTLRRTNTRQLTATARNNQNIIITGRPFRWGSSNSSIVSVDQNGLLTALTAGTVVISAEADQTVGGAAITVTEIPIGSCSLSPTSSKVTVTQSVQPTLVLRDTANIVIPSQGRPIVWTSNNENVVTVSSTGLATTRRAGTATVTASPAENAQVTCSTSIEAVDPRIVQTVIQQRTGSLRLGIPRGFSAVLLDSTSALIPAGRITTWSTNTPTVISITQAGIVTGLTLGTARVIARAEGVADTVTLSVTNVPVTSVVVSPLQVTMVEGQTRQLSVVVTDSTGRDVTDRPVEWITTDPTRATVSATGLITAIASGNVSIGASSEGRLGQTAVLIQQTPVDTIVAVAGSSVARGQSTAFAITLLDSRGNTLRNRIVVVTSDTPGIAVGAPNAQSTLVSVSGFAVGTATLTLQVVNNNNQNEGKATRVTITVTATAPGPVVPQLEPAKFP